MFTVDIEVSKSPDDKEIEVCLERGQDGLGFTVQEPRGVVVKSVDHAGATGYNGRSGQPPA